MSLAAPEAPPAAEVGASPPSPLKSAGMNRLLTVLLAGADADAVLAFRTTPEQDRRYRELRAAAERGTLSPVETAEFQAHRDVGQFAAYAKGWVAARRAGGGE